MHLVQIEAFLVGACLALEEVRAVLGCSKRNSKHSLVQLLLIGRQNRERSFFWFGVCEVCPIALPYRPLWVVDMVGVHNNFLQFAILSKVFLAKKYLLVNEGMGLTSESLISGAIPIT